MQRNARRLILAAAVAGLFVALPGVASANEAWPVTPLKPANGGVYGITPPTADGRVGSVGAELQTPLRFPPGTHAVIEVNAENVTGQDGTLADDKNVSFGLLYPRDSDPSLWAGTVSAGAFRQPGTYYFQFHANVADYYNDGAQWCPALAPTASGLCLFVSPVFTFTIQAPPAPVVAPPPPPAATAPRAPVTYSLSRYGAVTGVTKYVKRRLKGRQVKATCTRDDVDAFDCRVRYRRAGKRRSARIEVLRDASGLHYTPY